LEDTLAVLDQLRVDLRSGDRRMAMGRLGLISGWLQADSFVKTAWSDAEAFTKEGRKVAGVATTKRVKARAEEKTAEEHCHAAEAELKTFTDKHADDARRLEEQEKSLVAREAALNDHNVGLKKVAQEQATEHGRLEKLGKKMEVARRSLAVAEEAAIVKCDAFVSLEERLRISLRSLFGTGYEEPLATPKEGSTGLLPRLTVSLEDVAASLPALLEAEARDLAALVAMRICHHHLLQDSSFNLDALLEPSAPVLPEATVKVVEAQVEALHAAISRGRPCSCGRGDPQRRWRRCY
jgi:hypothetical protein